VLLGLTPLLFGDSWLHLLWGGVLLFALGIIILSDLRYFDIPDAVSLPTIAALLLASGAATAGWVVLSVPLLSDALLGLALCYGFLWLLAALPYALHYGRTRQWRKLAGVPLSYFTLPLEVVWDFVRGKQAADDAGDEVQQWMGGGDLRLAMIIGLALGAKLGLLAIMLGFISGTVLAIPLIAVRGREQMLPFGPFLILGMLLAWLWGEGILGWYLGVVGLD